jgi:hypothetical protein
VVVFSDLCGPVWNEFDLILKIKFPPSGRKSDPWFLSLRVRARTLRNNGGIGYGNTGTGDGQRPSSLY